VSFLNIFKSDATRHTASYSGHVVPDPARCVQCGICSYNCPIEIDVRASVCPRGVLRFVQTDLFEWRGE